MKKSSCESISKIPSETEKSWLERLYLTGYVLNGIYNTNKIQIHHQGPTKSKTKSSEMPLTKHSSAVPIITNSSRNIKNEIIIDPKFFKEDMIIIGQVWSKIILCYNQKRKTLFVVDQHAIHERIRYEYLLAYIYNIQNENDMNGLNHDDKIISKLRKFDLDVINLKNSQTILPYKTWIILKNPYITEVDASKYQISIKMLERYGFITKKTQDLGARLWISVTHVPAIYDENLGLEIFHDILKHCSNQATSINNTMLGLPFSIMDIPKKFHSLLESKSCKMAIKFNDILTKEECKRLITNLTHCDYPFYCVHGRNTLYPLMACRIKDICSMKRKRNPCKFPIVKENQVL